MFLCESKKNLSFFPSRIRLANNQAGILGDFAMGRNARYTIITLKGHFDPLKIVSNGKIIQHLDYEKKVSYNSIRSTDQKTEFNGI